MKEGIMAKETVSTWLSMTGSLRSRLSELKSLKESLTHRTRFYGEPERVEEPTYDIKMVDRMCTDLQNALFRIDRAIKQSNATVQIDLAVDYESLMRPIE